MYGGKDEVHALLKSGKLGGKTVEKYTVDMLVSKVASPLPFDIIVIWARKGHGQWNN